MLEKEKFYNHPLRVKITKIFLFIFICLFFSSFSFANIQEKIIKKYEEINTLSFKFKQKIGEKTETGNCLIKYPYLMKCEYLEKKKIIITDGKKFAIVKKRYKKIYTYPFKKTPLFFLLNKENILSTIKNLKPNIINSKIIEYQLVDENSNELNIFFDKNSLMLSGWKTIDAYSNQVSFIIKDIKVNILIDKKIFKIPREEDL